MIGPAVTSEDGFTLIELVVAVGILAMGCVVTLALLPSLLHQSESGLLRAAATTLAQDQIVRVSAAVAYYPPRTVFDPVSRARTTTNHAWALNLSATATDVVRLRRSLCAAGGATTDVPMSVSSTYDPNADVVVVTVGYPHTVCDPGAARDSVTLTAQLAPAQYAPQTVLQATILDPATQ